LGCASKYSLIRAVWVVDDPIIHSNVFASNGSNPQQQHSKVVHLKTFPKGHQVKLLPLALSSKRTDYVVTNDMTHDSTHDTQEVCALRWKIEQFHRESKQTTGIEGCQCRLARMHRNHIACAMLVWVRLKQVAQETASTVLAHKLGVLCALAVQTDSQTAFA
jgi:hypothetical protein